jgi:ankyrin repeat protein
VPKLLDRSEFDSLRMALPNMKLLIPAFSLLATILACDGASPWFDAIKAGDTVAIAKMLDAGADVEATNEWEGTALAEAVWSGKQEAIPILLARGANPNTSGQYGTPLCLAIDKWDTIAIRMLLEDPRTDVTLARRDGTTPMNLLKYFDEKFNATVAEALIKRGAGINGVNSEGWTPLMRSSWNGAGKWVSFLVTHGADIHIKNADGETAYVKAAQRGWFEIMKILESKGGKMPVLLNRSAAAKTPLTPAQRWALAAAAVLNQRNGESHEVLIPANFTAADRAAATQLLRERWGISDSDELTRALTALENSTLDSQYRAWDLCQYENVAQWGATAGYITEAEVWEGMLRVARQIQGTYKSWVEMSESYLAGRRRWYREVRTAATRQAQKAQPEIEFIVSLLLNTQDPNSPWTKCKWDTDFAAAAASESDQLPNSR